VKTQVELHDDEKALLTSFAGVAAFRILLPIIREFALFIAGRGPEPKELKEGVIPDLHSAAKLEKARCRALQSPPSECDD
jgi:hypothetical protein